MTDLQQVEILLVEDNPEDAEMTMRALRKRNLANQLHWVKDGEEALEYLFCTGRYAESRRARSRRGWCCSTSRCRRWTASRCCGESRPPS